MKRLVILGASGHAKVIVGMLEEMGTWEIAGCTSGGGNDGELLGYPVLGGDDILPKLRDSGIRHAFVAIGDNWLRRRVSERVRQAGFALTNVVSPKAIVHPRVQLGCGVAVMAGAVIQVDSVLGDGVIVNTGATVDHDCRIGSYAHLAPGVNLAGNVEIGEGTLLGVGSCVVPRIRVGSWAVVGAGAAVIEDVPDAVTVVGVPARVIKRRTHSTVS